MFRCVAHASRPLSKDARVIINRNSSISSEHTHTAHTAHTEQKLLCGKQTNTEKKRNKREFFNLNNFGTYSFFFYGFFPVVCHRQHRMEEHMEWKCENVNESYVRVHGTKYLRQYVCVGVWKRITALLERCWCCRWFCCCCRRFAWSRNGMSNGINILYTKNAPTVNSQLTVSDDVVAAAAPQRIQHTKCVDWNKNELKILVDSLSIVMVHDVRVACHTHTHIDANWHKTHQK